jgi:hypothetical protein
MRVTILESYEKASQPRRPKPSSLTCKVGTFAFELTKVRGSSGYG